MNFTIHYRSTRMVDMDTLYMIHPSNIHRIHDIVVFHNGKRDTVSEQKNCKTKNEIK